MTDITDKRNLIQQEEARYKSAVSEALLTRVGASMNFIMNRELVMDTFNLNGQYNIMVTPFSWGDGFISYPYPFEIVEVMLMAGSDVGDSGVTEIDLKWKAEEGDTYATIFSTTPKFTYEADPFEFTHISAPTKTGFTKPVLSKTQFDAFDVVRIDVLQALVGLHVEGAFLKVFSRPRDPT